MQISEMQAAEIKRVAEIESLSFARPWTADMLYEDLKGRTRARVFVARRGSEIVGHIGIWKSFDEIHVTTLAVDPEHRRCGLASALMEHVIKKYGDDWELTLEVRESNFAAIKLYNKFGFEVLGRRLQYYLDNREDALIMTRKKNCSGEEISCGAVAEYKGYSR